MKHPTPEQLLNIAQTHLNSRMTTLKPRNNDGLDFYEVSVWSIEAALLAAYELGYKDADQKAAEYAAGEDI